MRRYSLYIIISVAVLLLWSCSTTEHLPEGETLYTGIRSVNYVDQGDKKQGGGSRYEGGVIVAVADAVNDIKDALTGKNNDKNEQKATAELTDEEKADLELSKEAEAAVLPTVKEEVDAVLAYAPNNALFGSSTYRTPFPIGLWLYNAYGQKQRGVGSWLYRTFGSEPVLISSVAPETRANVAARVLHNYGYLRGRVESSLTIDKKNPRKAKVNYNIFTDRIFTVDSIEYLGFMGVADSLIRATMKKSELKRGVAFTAANLVAEQARLAKVLRNNGFYYYSQSMATYKADTVAVPYKAQLRLQPTMPLSGRMGKQWYIGRVSLTVLANQGDTVTHKIQMIRSGGIFAYSGKERPIKAGVIFRNMLHRKGNLYRAREQELTLQLLNQLGIFSYTSLEYTPRDTTATCDTLDVKFTGVLDQRYTADFELNVTERNGDRIGPGMSLAVKKKNAFKCAELLTLELLGSYAWKTNLEKGQKGRLLNSYEVGTKVSLDLPRIALPGFNPRKLKFPSSTSISFSADWLNRSGYYNLFTLKTALSYTWRKNFTSRHTLTPLSLTFDRLIHTSTDFDSILKVNPSLEVSMRNRFIPAIEYTYAYTQSSKKHRNPLTWQLNVKEAGGITSGIYAIAGRSFTERDKHLFNNPFAQYIKISTDLHNNFYVNPTTKLVTRLSAGIVYAYGNSVAVPYCDQFYAGGANSIRAFTIRGVGPGRFKSRGGRYGYLDQTGDFKLEANAELRFALYGQLEGALFVDAGNVWLVRGDDEHEGGKLEASHFIKDIALGTGAGVRYNLDFLVVRLDMGFAIHDPASTHSGYFNTGRLNRRFAFHFAIGYPF